MVAKNGIINSSDITEYIFLPQGGTQQQKDMIEQASGVIAQENVELACCFIQKCAVEKAIPEMDRRLATVSPAPLKIISFNLTSYCW